MTRPRAQIVSLEATPYYHCIARCVRRAWLCGTDYYSGQNFDHRKQWLLDRLSLLADVFSIDIASYAVMSNHYHVVLHVDVARAKTWTSEEVIQHWTRLYSGPELIKRHEAGDPLHEAELAIVEQLVTRWRQRLCDISWFMRCLNEYLARRANAEDGCKGRFWEARFKSQALLDEAALLSCMTYVDLNPVRAGIAETLEGSDYTSIQDRVRKVVTSKRGKKLSMRRPRLMPFSEVEHARNVFAGIPFTLRNYIELVDWTGRIVRQDKKGSIASSVPKIIDTLGLSNSEWQLLALDMQKRSITMFNGLEKIAQLKSRKLQKAA